jgi:hypothetical protein
VDIQFVWAGAGSDCKRTIQTHVECIWYTTTKSDSWHISPMVRSCSFHIQMKPRSLSCSAYKTHVDDIRYSTTDYEGPQRHELPHKNRKRKHCNLHNCMTFWKKKGLNVYITFISVLLLCSWWLHYTIVNVEFWVARSTNSTRAGPSKTYEKWCL